MKKISKFNNLLVNNSSWRKHPTQWSLDSNKHIINYLPSAA